MVILIAGASHTGKTALAQKLLEKYKYPYLSIDLLKMGLIRSGNTMLTPLSDDKMLTDYLWPIVSEMVKTAIENKQNLVVEGCYIPFDWDKNFEPEYLNDIKYYCLVMSEKYIKNHFDDIIKYANQKPKCKLPVDIMHSNSVFYVVFFPEKLCNNKSVTESFLFRRHMCLKGEKLYEFRKKHSIFEKTKEDYTRAIS